jgi:hypothetical protein
MNVVIESKPGSGRVWALAALAIAPVAIPLGVLALLGGYIVGLVLIALVPVFIVLVSVFAAIDRSILASKVRRLMERRNWLDDRATITGAQMVTSLKYLGRPFSVKISNISGSCPLSINSAVAWEVGADGVLSSPMCT